MGFFGSLSQETYDRQYSDRYLLTRIWQYMREHQRLLWIVAGALVGLSLVSAVTPVLVSTLVGVLDAHQGDDLLLLLVVGYLVIAVLNYGLNWTRTRLTNRIIAAVVAQMRKDAFAAAINRDLAFYDETKSGKVVSRITSDTQEFGQVLQIVGDIFTQLIQLVLLLIVLVNREWQLALLVVLWMPPFIGFALFFRWLARKTGRQGARAMAAVNDNIQESVAGIIVAKNFRREAMIYDEFASINRQSYDINLRRGFVLALIFPVLNALSGLAIASVVYFGAIAVLRGAISVGSWYLFVQSVDRFWFPFINLAGFWSQIQQGLSSAERIFALIDAENTVQQTDNRLAGDLRGEIAFDEVVFEYKPGVRVLDHFNLRIRPGESAAFVGHTGAGKSTIAKLIARFYEFQGGSIRVDGHDIRTFDLESYRSKLGIVSQQPFLFSGTVADNIRYSKPDASDADIEQIVYSVGEGEWLETLPNGLQTDVGERGAHLSMGQRQLVSLMRVLLQRPAIFVLDEATASVDPFTEMQIQQALNMILAQSTSILIAHRLSTVRSADRIIVLRDGQIIEEGSHEALVERGGHYAELYNTYFRHQSLSYIENAHQMMMEEYG